MAREWFIDTSGFYALLASGDPQNRQARRLLEQALAAKRRLITTDYVLDETATLLKARGETRVIEAFFEHVFQSAACRVVWTDEAAFNDVQAYFQKHADKPWSFTDCGSFCVMKELKLREALTTDHHFEQAGFVALLRPS